MVDNANKVALKSLSVKFTEYILPEVTHPHHPHARKVDARNRQAHSMDMDGMGVQHSSGHGGAWGWGIPPVRAYPRWP